MYVENIPVKILFIILAVLLIFFPYIVNFSVFSDQVIISNNKGLCYMYYCIYSYVTHIWKVRWHDFFLIRNSEFSKVGRT